MPTPDDKKTLFAARVAEFLLRDGMKDKGIRSLARAAGTSDRMLIYYFGTKDQLIEHSLEFIVSQLASTLDDALGTKRRSAAKLTKQLIELDTSPELTPTVQLWFEIVGLAARGVEPYKTKSVEIATTWLTCIESRLPAKEAHKTNDVFATLEGHLLLHVIGLG